MKNLLRCFLLLSILTCGSICSGQTEPLKIVFIRHGEKPEKGNNLTCKGLNRSLELPAVIQSKFGVPDFLYVPALKMGDKTNHARMLETVIPLAVKYNLAINSKFDEKDAVNMTAEARGKNGLVLVVWEHSVIPALVKALGINDDLKWPGDDYDSIWIVTFQNGKAFLTNDKEGLNPPDNCP